MGSSFMILELISMIGLFVVAGVAERYVSSKWRILYVVPTLLTAGLFVAEGARVYHLPIYVAVLVQMICLFVERKTFRKVAAAFSACLVLSSVIWTGFWVEDGSSSLADFEYVYDTMREHYVLTEEKGIDWDAIHEKYSARFADVDACEDYVYEYEAWQEYTEEFYDGHVSHQSNAADEEAASICQAYGTDFGLSLVPLTDGSYAAANVDGGEASYSVEAETEKDDIFYEIKDLFVPEDVSARLQVLRDSGIHNGTVITAWNGKPVDSYMEEVQYHLQSIPAKENEEFYEPMYVAGLGNNNMAPDREVPGGYRQRFLEEDLNDSVEVSYINDAGKECTVTLPAVGCYGPRLYDTMQRLDGGVVMTNMDWDQLDEHTALLRIYQMSYDMDSYEGVDYTFMTDEIRNKLLAYKEAGVDRLVIDLRQNGGGSPFFVEGVIKVFAPRGEQLMGYTAKINEKTATFDRREDGRYEIDQPLPYEGEDLWHDGEIIVLVNGECVSAGDYMAYQVDAFPNVKIMGLTGSNSSCQAVTSIMLSSGGVSFSAVPTLDTEGEAIIDTREDRKRRTPLDEQIPLTEEALREIFDEGEDYVLNYALQ